MKKKNKISKMLMLLVAISAVMFSCVEDDYDKPDIPQIPIGEVYTIQQVKDFYNNNGGDYTFSEDASVYGTVTMDEETDNSYKTPFIQDHTGGIAVFLNSSGSLYIGDSIRVYLKDLKIMKYNGLFQINDITGSNGVDVDANIIKQGYNNKRVPEEATLAQIIENSESKAYYQGRLVKLSDVQFVDTDTSKTYYWEDDQYAENKYIQDTLDNTMIVRTSSYATFADAEIPNGSGSIIAIVSQYNEDMQLIIRRSSEVEMNNARLDVGGGGGGTTIDPVASVNEDFSSAEDYTDITLTGWTNIAVQGDRKWQGKVFNSEKYIQASGYNSGLDAMETWIITPPVTGISSKVLSFKSAKAYWAHDAGEEPLRVYISTDFVGDNFETATWNELNVTVAGESDTDHSWIESGEVDLSAYSGNAAIAFKYVGSDTESTTIRLDDIMVDVSGGGGGGTTDPVTSFNIDFSQFANYDDVVIDGWQSFAETGSRLWQAKEFSGNVYAQGSAYNSTDAENIEWLITPPIDFDVNANEVLHFRSAVAYYTHEAFDLLISTDYDGTNYETATWTPLTATIAGSGNTDYEWVNSGDIDLSSYTGIGYIAFKYTGDVDQGQTGTFILDDIVLENR